MVIAVLSPTGHRTGTTTSSIFLALALAEQKRRVFLSHASSNSLAFEQYLGLKGYEDRTSTPSQLVRLIREGAIQGSDLSDYCKNPIEYLDVFTTTSTHFSRQDFSFFLDFILTSSSSYDYLVFDIDQDLSSPLTSLILKHTDLVLLNFTSSALDVKLFSQMKDSLSKVLRGKKVMSLCSNYEPKVIPLKDLQKTLALGAPLYPLRANIWLQRGANKGTLTNLFKLGRSKDPDVVGVYRDAVALATAVSKAKIALLKQKREVTK